MRKIFQMLSVLVMVFTLISPIYAQNSDRGTFVPNDESGIPDLALYEYIKNQTKKDDVYTNDLLGVTRMKLSDKLYSIKSLQGLGIMNLPDLKVLELDLSTLDTLEDILPLTTLKELHINDAAFVVLNSDINRLTNLSKLVIKNSKIEELPAALYDMISLTSLVLDNVALKVLSSDIKKLINLDCLELYQINAEIPKEIYDLEHLKVLVLNNMGIEAIDSQMAKLLTIEVLNLSNNKISKIPEFIYSMNSLQEIYLKNNRITELNLKVEQLTRLSIIDLSYNELVTLPFQLVNLQSLKTLSISNNKFTCLPNELGLLKLEGVFDFFKYNDVEKCEVEENPDIVEEINLQILDDVVVNNGYTTKNVTVFSETPVYFIINGVTQAEMESDITLEAEGKYAISAMRTNEGTSNTLFFTIDRLQPRIYVEDNDFNLEGFTSEVIIKSSEKGTFYVNEEKMSDVLETLVISENNDYQIYQYDLAGNKSNVLNFYIDKEDIEKIIDDDKKPTNFITYFLYFTLIVVLSIVSYTFLRKGANNERGE